METGAQPACERLGLPGIPASACCARLAALGASWGPCLARSSTGNAVVMSGLSLLHLSIMETQPESLVELWGLASYPPYAPSGASEALAGRLGAWVLVAAGPWPSAPASDESTPAPCGCRRGPLRAGLGQRAACHPARPDRKCLRFRPPCEISNRQDNSQHA